MMTKFKKYANSKTPNINVERKYAAPDWDKDFEIPETYGKLAKNIPELIELIKETAEVFRRNIPKSLKEIIEIEQTSMGSLKMNIRGGHSHSELHIWITKKTLRYTMRTLYSFRKLKPVIEKHTSVCEARALNYNLTNALRYIYEFDNPDESVEIENYANISGNTTTKGILVQAGNERFIFSGDEVRPGHRNFVEEIIHKLGQIKKEQEARSDEEKRQKTITSQFKSATELSEHFDVDNKEALRKRLERFRRTNIYNSDAFIESQNRGANKPKYLYNTEMVRPLIEKLKQKTSNKRPTKQKA